MSNQHIENLTIENFKCFKHLEVSNIGRVNLIGGKNNVGKTAFLETVNIFVSSNNSYELFVSICKILENRQDFTKSSKFEIDFFYDNNLDIIISFSSKICRLKGGVSFTNGFRNTYDNLFPIESLSLSVDNDTNVYPIELLSTPEKFKSVKKTGFNINKPELIYINPSKINEQNIAIYFGSLTELSLESFLNNSLSSFDDNIVELKPIPKENGIVLKLKLKNKKQLVLLSSLGEGINRYIAILCAIWASKDSVLLIDEIENGIHYTNYKKLWQIIFQASSDANCQVFATTHSKECIEAFNEAQLENENCNAQYFEFYRNLKKDLIVASNITKERLQYSLTHEGRVRGE